MTAPARVRLDLSREDAEWLRERVDDLDYYWTPGPSKDRRERILAVLAAALSAADAPENRYE